MPSERKPTIFNMDEIGKPFTVLWKFQRDDTSVEKPSWKYLDYKVSGCAKNPVFTWIRNPYFAYEHLSPYPRGE